MHKNSIFIFILLLMVVALPVIAIDEEENDDDPPATILNDEGGVTFVGGEVVYTNPFFTEGISEPLILLEDQTGFVQRDRDYVIPLASQQLGQITSNFFESPFTYSLSLPLAPQAPLNDVDNDDEDDRGVMIFQIAYWANTFGDAFLEERDLYGGGWSGAYSSARVSSDAATRGEYTGGKLLIFSPDMHQSFPSGFGEDGLLFTEDDPIVAVPAGYTVVDMDTDPFTFDRSRNATIDLIEGEGAAADDFSNLDYTAAFDAMLEKFRNEYAFTEYKNLDWDALYSEFQPRIEAAEQNGDGADFAMALREFVWRIPDGHVSASLTIPTYERFVYETDGGIGLALRELDDGRVVVTYVAENSPAFEAGIELRAEILSINDVVIQTAIDTVNPWSAPFSTDHVRRLQQLRYVTRYPIGSPVKITYRNPGSMRQETAELIAISELDSFAFSSFNLDRTSYELPVEYEPVGDYLLVRITDFLDDARLTIQLWERMIETANANDVPAMIIDMRNNGGGSGFLADQMAAYFFDEPLMLGNAGVYDETLGTFFFDPETVDVFYLPPEDLRYDGNVIILVGPNCASACEFFSFNMTLQNRATIIGQYPTAGLGGSVERFFMPDNITMQMTISRAVDPDGNIHIEGRGVIPDIRVPVNEDTVFSEDDPVLDAAVSYLNTRLGLD